MGTTGMVALNYRLPRLGGGKGIKKGQAVGACVLDAEKCPNCQFLSDLQFNQFLKFLPKQRRWKGEDRVPRPTYQGNFQKEQRGDDSTGSKNHSTSRNGDVELVQAVWIAKVHTVGKRVDFRNLRSCCKALVTVRTLTVPSLVKRMAYFTKLDVINAFLHGDLNEDV
ncbi:hypothetical protein Tco_1096791 [Tanacetum coccineum]